MPVTKVTLESGAIPGLLGGFEERALPLGPPIGQVLAHRTLGVSRPNQTVDLIAVHVMRLGAFAELKMPNHVGGGSVIFLAERASHALAVLLVLLRDMGATPVAMLDCQLDNLRKNTVELSNVPSR